MKKIITTFSTLAIVLFCSLSICSNAQDSGTKQPKGKKGQLMPGKVEQANQSENAAASSSKGQEAMMQAWQAYMTPGEFHKMLAKDDGTWSEEITMWMEPGAPPTTSKGTAENKMIMGGRYQESDVKAEFMGQPFEGKGIVGYDNGKKMVVSTWVDNMGTGVMTMEGKWDAASNSVMLKGKMFDPMTNKEETAREVYKRIDDNNVVLTMYNTKNGKEFKTMEIKMTRQ